MQIIRNATVSTYAWSLSPTEDLNPEKLPIPLPGSVLIIVVNRPGFQPDAKVETILLIGDGVELQDTNEVRP